MTHWQVKSCGCVKTDLAVAGRVMIRCERHRGRRSWRRRLCYFDADGIVRAERGAK